MKLKTLTLTLCLSFTGLIQAATTIAVYDFTTSIKNTSKYLGITASIDSEKKMTLQVQEFNNNSPIGTLPEAEVEKSIELTNSNFNIIDERVNEFARVEIQVTKVEYICMMMPSPKMYRNSLSVNAVDYRTGGSLRVGMKTIMGPSGCWVRSVIAPKNVNDIEKARALKDIIRIIALENLKEEL